MDFLHQGCDPHFDSKQQHHSNRTGASQTFSVQQGCGGTIYTSSSAVSSFTSHSPIIKYREIYPRDLAVLKDLHQKLFPVRYEDDFFSNVVHHHGIQSWAAVDISRAGPSGDEIVGFLTARVLSTAEIDTAGMLGCEISKTDRHLVYILTLGVAESYRRLGIASSLIWKVLNYASEKPTCRAVYLHVISYNTGAIDFYEKHSFQCQQKLQNFYHISGCHYDAYLYIYYVNGGRSPCLALDFLISISGVLRTFFASMATKFWKRGSKKVKKWQKYKEAGSLYESTMCIEN